MRLTYAGNRLILLGIFFISILFLNGCVPDFLVPNPDWVVIKQGEHEPFVKRKTGVLVNPTLVAATITFDSSCIYDLKTVDQSDWNKVIGLGFVGSENQNLGLAPHQIDGVRVGWRWNPDTKVIELACYAYVEGKRISFQVGEAKINEPIFVKIDIDYGAKQYRVMNGDPVPFTHKKTVAYKTGLYFGGNRPAPHRIQVKIVE